ncbi:D-alanyl-D-alanine carboxypeptidase family protein [Litorimonas sp. RW-G-Af-16]|uniref:D-alanyl-D-alanine carboxypeptidase family protein n=1 Tax=Litorimonas sp. RW-G-Af-16 TaxID=3241168 RepID=UPI00390CA966
MGAPFDSCRLEPVLFLRYLFSSASLTLLALSISTPAFAQYNSAAPHAVIMDFETGQILYEKNARQPMAPASMTKIMTVEMVLEAIKSGNLSLDAKFTVSEEAWRRGGTKSGSSTMFLKLGSQVRVEDLLRGAIIQSGNDACITLAEGLAGSEDGFAAQMSARAKTLGLESATFRNSTGWPHPEHEISAVDLASLSRHLISEHAEFYPIYSERSFTWNGITQSNRNPLLGKLTGADGIKTGSTEASGFGLVGSAKRGDDRRIIVINGLANKAERQAESLALMEAAFSQFQIYNLYKSAQVIGEVDVYMGKSATVPAALGEDIKMGLHISQRGSTSAKVEYVTAVAPIAKGDKIAELVISAPGKDTQRYPLFATQDVKAKSLFGKAWTSLLNKIRG